MTDYFGAMGTAIYNTLAAGASLISELGGGTAIYSDQAPDGTSLPYVVYSHQGGGKENIISSNLRNNVWFVRGYAATRPQANRIDGHCEDLLDKHKITVSGYTNFWTVREDDFALVENPPNQSKVYMAGGMYRIRLTGA